MWLSLLECQIMEQYRSLCRLAHLCKMLIHNIHADLSVTRLLYFAFFLLTKYSWVFMNFSSLVMFKHFLLSWFIFIFHFPALPYILKYFHFEKWSISSFNISQNEKACMDGLPRSSASSPSVFQCSILNRWHQWGEWKGFVLWFSFLGFLTPSHAVLYAICSLDGV